MLSLLRNEIVATLGPSINQPETLEKALLAGIDVCRVNCSHSDAAGIRKSIALVRRTAAKMGRSVGILLDLQGPKIRWWSHRRQAPSQEKRRLNSRGQRVYPRWQSYWDNMGHDD